jgi:hypothetical protein
MKRIFRITRIVPSGATDPVTRPGFLGNCRSGCYSPGSEPYAETNKTRKRSRLGELSYNAAPNDQSNQANPLHPDETSVSVARINGGQN